MKKKYRALLVANVVFSFLLIVSGGCASTPSDNLTQTLGSPNNENANTTAPALVSSNISGKVVYSAVVSREPRVTQIFLKDLETNEIIQLTHSGDNLWPRWSPDGSQVVYLSWSREKSYDIYIMNDDGTNSQPLVASVASEKTPDWSPLRNKIVFVSNEDETDQIYVIDLNSLLVTKLTNNLAGVSTPQWSTDGKRIAFTANTGVSGRSQVFIVDADGLNLQQVTSYDIDNFEGNPVWCPDDSCIIFTRFVNGVPKLMLLDLSTKEVTPLLQGVFADNLQETRLARSPLRQYITFSIGDEYYAININTGELHSLGVSGLDLSLYP